MSESYNQYGLGPTTLCAHGLPNLDTRCPYCERHALRAEVERLRERLDRIDAFAGERCEASGCRPDPCGPVEYHDVEGVPLCAECWQECLDEAAEEERGIYAEAEREEREVLASVRTMLGGAIAEQDTVIALAEAAEKEHARAEKTREILAAAERDADKAEADSSALTEALERIAALKASLLEQLPIKGLEIRDGAVFVDGLPFERVNSARQIEVAFQVAKLRAGKVGLIVADGLERFDEETYRTFEAAAASAGLQFVVGRVGQGELSVRALPEEEGRAA